MRSRGASAADAPAAMTGPHARPRLMLFGSGTEGNEQLTAVTGVLLIVLLAIIGVTILRIRQLISVHLFVGLLLIGPVALKMASTGYRFARYYTRAPAYRRKGPPELLLRAIAPVVVVSTVIVFVSGMLLLVDGAGSRDSYLELHKVSFIVWIAFTAVHVLWHLPRLSRSLKMTSAGGAGGVLQRPGQAGLWLALTGAVLGGVVLAIVLIPDFASWSHAQALHHRG